MTPSFLTLLTVLVTVTNPGPGSGCDRLGAWIEASTAGFPDGIPPRIAQDRLPGGPGLEGTVVVGGRRPDGGRGVEFAIVRTDTTLRVGTARAAWLNWVEQCMSAEHPDWRNEEIDLEAELDVPAAKAMGQFPSEAYIREDAEQAGIRFRHPESGVTLSVVTDPTVIASRAGHVGYEGPRVVVLVRIEAPQ